MALCEKILRIIKFPESVLSAMHLSLEPPNLIKIEEIALELQLFKVSPSSQKYISRKQRLKKILAFHKQTPPPNTSRTTPRQITNQCMLLFPAVTSCGNRSRNFISEQTNLCFPCERTIILRCTLAVFNVLFSAHMTEISMGKAKWVEASRKGTDP